MMQTKIAIPEFRGFVAPRIDCAPRIVIVTISGDRTVETEEFIPSLAGPFQMPKILKDRGVAKVICGGVPQMLYVGFQEAGIEVVFGVIGQLDEVIQAYIRGTLRENTNFCFARRCRRGRGGRRRGRGRNRYGGMDV